MIAYIRISKARFGRPVPSPEEQWASICQFCERHGYLVLSSCREDEASRAPDTLERYPGLSHALALAKRKKCSMVVASLDRLSRDVISLADLMHQPVPIIVAGPDPDAGSFVLQNAVALARRERRLIAADRAAVTARQVTRWRRELQAQQSEMG
ncbi:recombinase family protein [Methylobacterium nigriterrae]|uniref:recombinase family protein n=1 Tax=Methylobacterium nigriterrae TaxID=3127512 RepID=UPI0030133EF8